MFYLKVRLLLKRDIYIYSVNDFLYTYILLLTLLYILSFLKIELLLKTALFIYSVTYFLIDFTPNIFASNDQ